MTPVRDELAPPPAVRFPGPPPQPPMPTMPRALDDRLGGFAQRSGGFSGASELLAAAGLIRGMGGANAFGAGDALSDRLTADLKRMTQQLQRRTTTSTDVRRSAVSAMALGEDLASVIYGNGSGDVRLARFGELGDQPIGIGDAVEEIDVGEHGGLVTAAAASPDGRIVVTADSDGAVRAWNPSAGEQVGALDIDEGVSSLAVATDGRLCVIGCDNGSVHLARLPELDVTRTLQAHRGPVHAVDAASSRRLVVTAGDDGSVRTWDPVGGGGRLTKRHHDGAIASVVVSRDRRWILSGGWDGKAVLWSARSGDIERELVGHDDIISGVAFDAAAEYAVTVSDDRAARVWRLDDGEVVSERRDFDAAPKFARFSRDSRFAYVGAWDGTLRRLPAAP